MQKQKNMIVLLIKVVKSHTRKKKQKMHKVQRQLED